MPDRLVEHVVFKQWEKQMRNTERPVDNKHTDKYIFNIYIYIALEATQSSPADGAESPAALQLVSMASASSGKYGIRVVKGNTNKKPRQVFQ